MLLRIITLFVVLAFGLTACSRAFQIFPEGSLDAGIHFEFGAFDGSRTKNRIVAFNVYAVSNSRLGEPIWSLEGRARVNEIRYGIPPKKLREKGPAEALQPMRIYAVEAIDDPRGPMSVPGSAFVIFYISEAGVPIACESLSHCQALLQEPA